jgi:hypothetical protein
MDVGCHVHAQAALLPEKAISEERIEGWARCRGGLGILEKGKSLASDRNGTNIPRSSN